MGSPVEISGVARGKGDASVKGVITFDPMQHMQRPALLLNRGTLWLAFGSHADTDPYHGWIFLYDANSLTRKKVICVSPNGNEAGFWQAGQGPTADAKGSVYLMVGNGTFDGQTDFGDSFLKYSPTGGLTDFFTPYNQQWLADVDADLGSAGVVIIPGTSLIAGVGKEGKVYLLDTANMGKFNPNDDSQIKQSFFATNGHVHGSPVFYKGSFGSRIYLWSEYDNLKAFTFMDGMFDSNPKIGPVRVPDGMPGAFLSISANGARPGTAIVWANHSYSGDANPETRPGILRAFDANTLKELWNSRMNEARDDFGNFAKFSYPTIANGKVYLATFSNKLVVYGIVNANPPPKVRLTSPKDGATFRTGSTVNMASTATDPDGVTKVEFYANGQLLGTDDTAPYTLAWANVAAGTYAVQSKAYDTYGGQGVSEVATIAVGTFGAGLQFSLDFRGAWTNSMGADEVAGVFPLSHWNDLPEATGNRSFLLDSKGALSTLAVSWNCDNTWALPIADDAGNSRMMRGYLDTGMGMPATVTVSGLSNQIVARGYDVYVYVDGDNGGSWRNAVYSIGDLALPNSDNGVDFRGTFVQGPTGNYVVFRNLNLKSFVLTGTPKDSVDGVPRAPINGIQIVAR
jgi:hypothetical protein